MGLTQWLEQRKMRKEEGATKAHERYLVEQQRKAAEYEARLAAAKRQAEVAKYEARIRAAEQRNQPKAPARQAYSNPFGGGGGHSSSGGGAKKKPAKYVNPFGGRMF